MSSGGGVPNILGGDIAKGNFITHHEHSDDG